MELNGKTVPNPGSQEALDLGCTCAVMDNNYGAGFPWGEVHQAFWITEGCPIHSEGVSFEEVVNDSQEEE